MVREQLRNLFGWRWPPHQNIKHSCRGHAQRVPVQKECGATDELQTLTLRHQKNVFNTFKVNTVPGYNVFLVIVTDLHDRRSSNREILVDQVRLDQVWGSVYSSKP
jgi:hypothetical protein